MSTRSLVSSLTHAEVTAVLENLHRMGVDEEGLAHLRGKLPKAFEKQLARFINAGSFSTTLAMSGLECFNVRLGTPTIDKVRKSPIFPTLFGIADGWDQTCSPWVMKYRDDWENTFPRLEESERSFILLTNAELFVGKNPKLKQMLTNDFLEEWSEDYLVGMTLKLCRPDAPVYLARHHDKMVKEGIFTTVATDPEAHGGKVFSIGRKGSYLAVNPMEVSVVKELVGKEVRFIFELVKN